MRHTSDATRRPSLQIKYRNQLKRILRPEKNWFIIQNSLFNFFCTAAFYIFFVLKYEPFKVERSMRLFWKEQTWLDKIMRFNFLRN